METYEPWVEYMGSITDLLMELVGGQPLPDVRQSLVGCLDVLGSFRKNYGINYGFLPESIPGYIRQGLLPFP
eukprot:8178461-Prorocentrum_lima.AAC.1